ncbi:MAG: molybdenum cofactor guanylyltransferase [Sphaerobacteraceae bacterium]|nr:MAG: molybdenum cofactor guanylyltransferase [Sphaerobacteraceae bacterium]
MSRSSGLSAAILAGGQSRRMGEDKALLEVDGRPMIEYVINAAKSVADETIIVATDRPEYEQFECRVVPDRLPKSGSLGGIYTALSEVKHDRCLVLACDMPFVNVKLLQHMIDRSSDYDVLIPSLDAERSDQGVAETLETLHAIYSKSCLPAIQRQLDAGVYKVVGFFTEVNVQKVPQEEVAEIDSQLLSFFNTNTPEEFEWAKQQLASGSAR